MALPPWAIFALAAWLLLFGSFRILLALRGRRRGGDGDAARGMLSVTWRRHLVFGLFYLVVGTYLVAMGFGYGVPTAAVSDPVSLPTQPSDHLEVR